MTAIRYVNNPKRLAVSARRLRDFSLRVVRAFIKNRGILLAGGVGYNVLLSAIPVLALLCVLLTHIVDEQRLLSVLTIQAGQLAPAHADLIIDAVNTFLDSRDVIGVVGILALLFFSSFAFRMLEDSIAIIFEPLENPAKRSFWVSAALPYAFILVLGVGLLALMLLVDLGRELNEFSIALTGWALPFANASEAWLNLFGFVGTVLLLSAVYKVMPVARVASRRALVGGFVAGTLWQVIGVFLAYYFANISLVNAVYGSLATMIVVLLSLEIGAIVLLLGAQVIAELERSSRAGVSWYIDPEH